MEAILVPVISVTTMGVVLSAILCIASKLMYVKTDERVAQLLECLPGVNCGVCGYPGCSGYATALGSDKNIKNNLCTPGGNAVMTKLCAILGVEAGSAVTPKYAVVHCGGDCTSRQKKMNYRGILSCVAAKQVCGGDGACSFGCLGYGDCQKVCPTNAVNIVNGLARIDPELCTGCGLCVKTCPSKMITIEDANIPVVFLCNSIEKGAIVRKKCAKGCIVCGKCVRACMSGAITLEDHLVKIDHEKCSLCGGCAEVCVTGTIRHTAVKTGNTNRAKGESL